MSAKLPRLRWLFHPISIFVVAQVSWGLLMFVWIRWYVMRSKEIDDLVHRIPMTESLRTGQSVVLIEGCLLMAIILVGLYVIFVSLRKQVRLNKLQDSILSSVTHELKTPLASIRLYSETMLLRDLGAEERNKFLRRMLAEAERLQKLIDTVLISARIEGGNPGNESERIDLSECAERCFRRARDRMGDRRQMTLKKTGLDGEGAFWLTCNPHQMEMIFDNLLDNAVKYTGEGGKIDVGVEAARDTIRIRVSDDGLGIDKAHLKKIFNKFYRSDRNAVKKVHGSGLGLFVSHSIVKAHDGRIYATSDGQGKGASFYVEFQRNSSDD